MSRILHIVPGTGDVANGMVVVARLLAKEQDEAAVVDLNEGVSAIDRHDVDEVWVHGMWLPKEWIACRRVLKSGKRLVRMTHGSLSPVYLQRQSPLMKRLVSPIERYFFRKADKVVATCEAEAGWIRAYEPRVKQIEVVDLKRFFNFNRVERVEREEGMKGEDFNRVERVERVDGELHVLYLGRRHPLKGVEYLEAAVRQIQDSTRSTRSTRLKIVSSAFGDELEKVWDWCDVLVLPTLSENFGLVVAEALERGKRAITTDGAPAWEGNLNRVEHVERVDGELWSGYGGRLLYLKGYRDGSDEKRVELLRIAIERICG